MSSISSTGLENMKTRIRTRNERAWQGSWGGTIDSNTYQQYQHTRNIARGPHRRIFPYQSFSYHQPYYPSHTWHSPHLNNMIKIPRRNTLYQSMFVRVPNKNTSYQSYQSSIARVKRKTPPFQHPPVRKESKRPPLYFIGANPHQNTINHPRRRSTAGENTRIVRLYSHDQASQCLAQRIKETILGCHQHLR